MRQRASLNVSPKQRWSSFRDRRRSLIRLAGGFSEHKYLGSHVVISSQIHILVPRESHGRATSPKGLTHCFRSTRLVRLFSTNNSTPTSQTNKLPGRRSSQHRLLSQQQRFRSLNNPRRWFSFGKSTCIGRPWNPQNDQVLNHVHSFEKKQVEITSLPFGRSEYFTIDKNMHQRLC